MFLTDPALRRIAAATNDVLPEHLWRHDTAAADALGDLARILHKTALGFNDSTTTLDKALARVGELSEAAQQQLTTRAHLHMAGYRQALTDALAATPVGRVPHRCRSLWVTTRGHSAPGSREISTSGKSFE